MYLPYIQLVSCCNLVVCCLMQEMHWILLSLATTSCVPLPHCNTTKVVLSKPSVQVSRIVSFGVVPEVCQFFFWHIDNGLVSYSNKVWVEDVYKHISTKCTSKFIYTKTYYHGKRRTNHSNHCCQIVMQGLQQLLSTDITKHTNVQKKL